MGLFKKSSKKPLNGEGIQYSMTPRHGHNQDVFDKDGVRQVAGCLPIDPINKRFLLVTSSSNPDTWVIPKGGWEKDETQKQAAMRETWEEAGVKGTITRHVGIFAEKSKNGIKAHHWIYEMEIKEVTKKFPEMKKRARRWFTYDEAMLVVKAHYIHDALSMSSLSPLLNGKADAGEDGEKKKKKKKEKKKSSDDEDDEELTEEEKAAKKEKKRLKKEKKAAEKAAAENDEEEDEEDSDEDKKKKKKKNKNKKGEITELMDDEIEQFGKHQPVVEVEEVFDPMNQHLRQLYVSDQNKPTTFKEEKQQV